ncbi:MAG TPA: hypothetical protein VFV66_20970 [Nonomuraea sp.]|nr:hypothetical protein [Nonomuraea sp.]
MATLRYVDVWEFEESWAKAFDEGIHPVVHATFVEVGFTDVAEPTVHPLHLADPGGAAVPAPSAGS